MTYLQMALKFGPAILALVFGVLYWNARGTISDLQNDKTELAADLKGARESIELYASAVDDRDAMIRRQNESIQAYKQAADKNRRDYEEALWAAQRRAQAHVDRADELLALTAPEGELAQCRAARDLLEAELVR